LESISKKSDLNVVNPYKTIDKSGMAKYMYKFGEIIVNVRANKANFGPTKIRPFWD